MLIGSKPVAAIDFTGPSSSFEPIRAVAITGPLKPENWKYAHRIKSSGPMAARRDDAAAVPGVRFSRHAPDINLGYHAL
jgi:hypothetical protein